MEESSLCTCAYTIYKKLLSLLEISALAGVVSIKIKIV